MDFDDQDNFDSMPDDFAESGMNQITTQFHAAKNSAARSAGGALKTALKRGTAVFAKQFLVVVGVIAGVLAAIILLVIIIGAAWNFMKDERGTAGNSSLNYQYENPTEVSEDDGLQHAVALVEPQALIDAYYKYMSCCSHQKYYNGEMYLFQTPEQTEDFAGLMDYYQRENYFYLSSYFIQMADELLHEDQFYYPEQIIKPVYFEVNDDDLVTALPICDKETKTLTAVSKAWSEDGSEQTDEDVPGVWDYGFGSVLQYGPFQKDEYIKCKYKSLMIEIHTMTKTSDPSSPSGFSYSDSHTSVVSIPITEEDTLDSVKEKIAGYNEAEPAGEGSYKYVYSQPGEEFLRLMFDEEYNNHIPQKVELIDQKIAERDFNDSNLAEFSNADNNGYYPINIPLITSAATMSGNIKYAYDLDAETTAALTEDIGHSMEDPMTDIAYAATCEDCDDYDYLCGIRTGDVHTAVPTPTETAEPWGFDYLDMYAANYVTYVPQGVLEDIDFSRRVNEEENPKVYETIKELGLLKELPDTTPAIVTAADMDDVQMLAKMIAVEASHNKIDELMVGAVAVNRVHDSRFPDTLVGVLSAPGQYSTWASGAIAGAVPSERDYESARQVLSGEFSIPANIVYQMQKAPDYATLWYRNENAGTGGNPHYYSYPKQDTLASVDWAGRTVSQSPTAMERLAESLGGAQGEGESINTPVLSAPDVIPAIDVDSIDSPYTLYTVQNFDVLRAIAGMQKITDENDTWFSNLMGKIFESILEQLQGFFDLVSSIFPSNDILDTPRVRIPVEVNPGDARDIVYQAITFSNKVSYSAAADSLSNADDLMFLFVGKEGSLGLGTSPLGYGTVPGTDSSIEGFSSPTSSYYQASEPYSTDHPYVVLAVPAGTVVQSVGPGTVTVVHDIIGETEYGRGVEVESTQDGHTYRAVYGHLETISVDAGMTLETGDQIGTVGEDGLYFQFYVDGVVANPMQYFYQSGYTDGVPFLNLIGPDGKADMSQVELLRTLLGEANNKALGVYDRWHSRPINGGILWECPWYAWGRGAQYLESIGYPIGSLPKSFGNGGDYYIGGSGNKTSDYFVLGQTPRAHSWVSWVPKTGLPRKGAYGHVAFVEAVEADGSYWISEAYRTCGGVPLVRHVTSGWLPRSDYKLAGFVYLDSPL